MQTGFVLCPARLQKTNFFAAIEVNTAKAPFASHRAPASATINGSMSAEKTRQSGRTQMR